MSAEIGFMIAALILMFAAVGAKLFTTQLIAKIEQGINAVTHEKNQILNNLKVAEAQKEVAEKNVAELKKKRVRLIKKISKLNEEIS